LLADRERTVEQRLRFAWLACPTLARASAVSGRHSVGLSLPPAVSYPAIASAA